METTIGKDLWAEKPEVRSANDRFKDSFNALFWLSLILATAFHFALFDFSPEMSAEAISYSTTELTAFDLPAEIEIPPAPRSIARPAMPVIATGEIDEDITIAPTTFKGNPVSELPPPPSFEKVLDEQGLSRAPVFTPYTVKPDIKNREEVRSALEREYPPTLRQAGLGGTVLLWFFIDKEGRTVRSLVQESSGYPLLDDAALRVAEIVEFTPACNRDKSVPVWISLPLVFRMR